MVTAFRHGVYPRYENTVPQSIRAVPTSVVFVVGSAPIYLLPADDQTVDELLLLNSDLDDSAKVGSDRPGFTLPKILEILRRYGVKEVDAVNVFDPAVHATTATSIDYTFDDDDEIQLKRVDGSTPTAIDAQGIDNLSVATYVVSDDYTVNALTGVITRVSTGAIAAGETITVTYDYADPALVSDADIIGAVTNGVRSGLQMAYDIAQLRGRYPNLIVTGEKSESEAVAAAMEIVAANSAEVGNNCLALIEAPNGITLAEAIAGRGGAAEAPNFDTALNSTKIFYAEPYGLDGVTVESITAHAAGVIVRTDREQSVSKSPSNEPLIGVTGIRQRFTETELNQLNAQGIVTVKASFAGGYRLWGNRTAAYPSKQTPYEFTPGYRTIGSILDALKVGLEPYIDRRLNNALISAILTTCRGFLDQYEADEDLLPGSTVEALESRNPPAQLAQGKLVLTLKLFPPVPLVELVPAVSIDLELLSNLELTTG